jgi:hypothetical protein
LCSCPSLESGDRYVRSSKEVKNAGALDKQVWPSISRHSVLTKQAIQTKQTLYADDEPSPTQSFLMLETGELKMSENEKGQNKEKEVTIIVDEIPTKILPGTYSLTQFKQAVNIDASKVVEMFVKGKFVTINDSDPIEVKAGEKFSSHVPRGGSSWK